MKVINKRQSFKPNDLGYEFQHVHLQVKRLGARKFQVNAPSLPSMPPSSASSQAEAIQDFHSKLLKAQVDD